MLVYVCIAILKRVSYAIQIIIINVQFEFNQYFIFREKPFCSFSHLFLC